MTDKTETKLRRRAAPDTSYEVQVFAGGKWATEVVLEDRKEAEEEAIRTLESGRRPLGVRVVREEVDDKTGLITATTIFRRTREDERSAEAREDRAQAMKAKVTDIRVDRRRAARSQPAEGRPAQAEPHGQPAGRAAPAARSFHWMWLLVLLGVLMIAGLVTVLKLHALFFGG